MKLPRPYIPLDVRLVVIERQVIAYYGEKIANFIFKNAEEICGPAPFHKKHRLRFLLGGLFGAEQVHLDHDPPLMNREFNPRTGKYIPDANNSKHLIYRDAQSHKIKTLVRGDGALRSDVAQRRYLNRVAANRKPKKKFKPRRAKHIRRITNAPISAR